MNKMIATLSLSFMGILFCLNCYAANLQVKIQGEEAKSIYTHLTGKKIEEDTAVGHVYKKGKNILCEFIQADMSDEKQIEVPRFDARRYSCSLHVTENGKVVK